jgi:ABC-type Mn2+/Zn2+ transport system permease subunit
MLEPLLALFEYEFIWITCLAVVGISLLSGLLSPIVVLKQRTYISETLAHLVFPGIVTGHILYSLLGLPFWVTIFSCAFLTATFGSYLSEWILKTLKIPPDAAAIVSLTGFLALGLLEFSCFSFENRLRPETILFGDILSLHVTDLYILYSTLVAIFIFIFVYKDHWDSWLSDPEFGKIAGFSVTLLDKVFPFLITLTVLLGVFSVGGLMISALVTFPAVIVTPKKSFSLPILGVSLLIGLLGVSFSFLIDAPIGPSIALIGFIMVILKACLVSFKLHLRR